MNNSKINIPLKILFKLLLHLRGSLWARSNLWAKELLNVFTKTILLSGKALKNKEWLNPFLVINTLISGWTKKNKRDWL